MGDEGNSTVDFESVVLVLLSSQAFNKSVKLALQNSGSPDRGFSGGDAWGGTEILLMDA